MGRFQSVLRGFALFCCLTFTLSACGRNAPEHNPYSTQTESNETTPETMKKETVRGIWISYLELPATKGATKAAYTKTVDEMFREIRAQNLNTVFLHVRAFADAIYPSDLFPFSSRINGSGTVPDYDPLQIMVTAAKECGIALHAWINPFRVSSATDIGTLDRTHPARLWGESDAAAENGRIYIAENGIYFNPASPAVHKLVLDGVREILQNYDVDGIHIDDYFYPTTADAIDQAEYTAYQADGGTLGRSSWRRSMINSFVAGLYDCIKQENPQAILSISPDGDIERNAEKHFADVAEWAKTPGYADMLIPQLYYGFSHDRLPFEATAEAWMSLCRLPDQLLVFGLAPYKVGKADDFAGAGRAEWQKNPDIVKQQISCIQALEKYDGYALYSYSYVVST